MNVFTIHKRNPLYEKLISEVKKRSLLWNVTDVLHRSKKEKAKAWKEIANKLNISENAAKRKWQMLRAIFLRYIKKNRPKNVTDYTGKWKYFHSMWFLRAGLKNMSWSTDNLPNEKTEAVVPVIIESDVSTSSMEDGEDYQFSTSDDEVLQNIVKRDVPDTDRDQMRLPLTRNNTKCAQAMAISLENDLNPQTPTSITINNIESNLSQTIPTQIRNSEINGGLSRTEESMDGDELFLKSLAPFLRKLTPVRNLAVRGKFQEILMYELER